MHRPRSVTTRSQRDGIGVGAIPSVFHSGGTHDTAVPRLRPSAERGQAGIGTLILFIAVVLVAAVTAGVLISTTGLLQTQAQETGTESTEQVTDNVEIINTAGTINETGDVRVVNETRIAVQLAPSATRVDLERLAIQYTGGDNAALLVYEDRYEGDVNRGGYRLHPITTSTDENVLIDTSERYEIVIPVDGQSINGYPQSIEGGLGPAAEVEITISTRSGAQRTTTLRTPNSFAGTSDGSNVPL